MVAGFVNREWATAGYENRRKPAPVASEFDWIPSPRSDGYRQFKELWVSGEGYVAEGLPVSRGHGLHGD